MKKKFHFKLEGLRRLRELKEKRIKGELGQILKDIEELKVAISNVNEEIKLSYEEQRDAVQKGMTLGLNHYPRFVKTKEIEIEQFENTIYSLNKKYQEKLKDLGKAMGETKVLEKLKEKKFKIFQKEQIKKETQDIEELFNMQKLMKKEQEFG